MKNHLDRSNKGPLSLFRPMPLFILGLGLLSVVLVLWVGRVNEKQRSNFVLTDAVMDLQIHASTAHLWLEEALTAGPRHVDMEELWREFDRAIAPSEAILSGGLTHHGPISDPLKDPALRSQAESIRSLLMEFKTLAAERLEDSGSAGIGTAQDKRYNILFRDILEKANALEHSILESELRSHERLRLIFWGILLVWSCVVIAAALALWNREVRHESADLALRKAHDVLDMRVKERTAELSMANARLQDERNNLGSILDSMNNGVRIVNRQYDIQYINPVLQREFGPAGGRKCYQYFSGRDEVCPSCELQAVLAGKTVQQEWRSEKNGRTYDLFSAPIKNPDGSVSKLEIFHDITKRKLAEVKVINSEVRLREAQRMAHIGNWELDAADNRLVWSDEIYRIFELVPKDFGASYEAFLAAVHPDDRAMVDKAYSDSVKNKTPYEITHRLLMPDGRIKLVHERGETSYNGDDKPVRSVGTVQDVTEQNRAADKIRKQLDCLSALRSIDLTITASLDLRVTLGVVIEHVMTQLGVDAVSLLVKKPHLHVFEYVAGKGFRTEAVRHSHVGTGRGYAGHAAHTRKLLAIPDIAEETEGLIKPPFVDEEGFRGYFGAPLIAKGGVIGVLEVFLRRPFNPDGEWTDFLEALAGQAAIAVDNANLFNEIQRSNDELIMAYNSTLEGWARALDYRDKETEGHSRRVTDVTVELARTLGIGEEDIVHMKRGALLHDIGKLGVPDRVLLKPGKLDAEELKQMQQHPRIAYELIYPIEFLRPAIDIPFCHHEKWDGTGYPRGLKGEDIPFSARIFSVVDVWDALRSERPYRPAWTVEKVKEYLRAQAGIDFDPHTVDVFLRHSEKNAFGAGMAGQGSLHG